MKDNKTNLTLTQSKEETMSQRESMKLEDFDRHGIATIDCEATNGFKALLSAEIIESREKAILVELPAGVTTLGQPHREWLPKSQVRWVDHPQGIFWPQLHVKTWLVAKNNLWHWAQ